ncbi:MAG: hypothetical protein NVSMB9_25000 [Isosphaeraceae bacterium]
MAPGVPPLTTIMDMGRGAVEEGGSTRSTVAMARQIFVAHFSSIASAPGFRENHDPRDVVPSCEREGSLPR